jgi:hypothetical protein
VNIKNKHHCSPKVHVPCNVERKQTLVFDNSAIIYLQLNDSTQFDQFEYTSALLGQISNAYSKRKITRINKNLVIYLLENTRLTIPFCFINSFTNEEIDRHIIPNKGRFKKQYVNEYTIYKLDLVRRMFGDELSVTQSLLTKVYN